VGGALIEDCGLENFVADPQTLGESRKEEPAHFRPAHLQHWQIANIFEVAGELLMQITAC
jgi:hypothetical protein